MKTQKIKIGTIETQLGVEMICIGHNNAGKPVFMTLEHWNKTKMNERRKLENKKYPSFLERQKNK